MGKADIFLEEDRISVVGGDGPEEVDGVERGDLEITTDKSGTPDVRLNADWANLTLGGGDGQGSEGDVKLLDRDGNNRVTVTAEGNNSPTDEMRAWIDGERGRLELGQNDEYDIHIPQIWLDGPNGEVGIADDPRSPRDSTILLSADERSVTVGAGVSDAPPASLSLLSEDATVEATTAVDDERYQSELRMHNGDEAGGIRLRTTSWEYPDVPAGIVEVFDEEGSAGVLLDGDAAGIKLGYAYTAEFDASEEYGGGGVASGGKSGRLLLDDGDAGLGLLSDSEESSTVFEIRASEGRLEVSSLDANNPRFTLDASGRLEVANDAGDAVFTVDPDREVLEIPDAWHIESGGDTVLE